MDTHRLPLIQSLDTIQPQDVDAHGGKATNLARLHCEGILTPIGFSISSENFVQMRDRSPEFTDLLDRLEDVQDFEDIVLLSEKIQGLIGLYELSKDLKSEIIDELKRMKELKVSSESGYAVRSSASIEDRSDISFAGQAETFLCVRDSSNIFEAVKQVWRSVYSPSAVVYLRSKRIMMKQVKMAVVVQEMIPAVVSGVMFTANVVNNDTNEMLINSTWGLGETIVSGRVIPDTFVLSKRPLRILQRELGSKRNMSVVSRSKSGAEVITRDTPSEKCGRFTLSEHMVMRVAQLGVDIERRMGAPQDIEWCLRPDNEIVILQSRPITTLRIPG